MVNVKELRDNKYKLLVRYNDNVLKQIKALKFGDFDKVEKLSMEVDSIISMINKIDTQVMESNDLAEFNRAYKSLLLEIKDNSDRLLEIVAAKKTDMGNKKQSARIGRTKFSQYKAYNNKTSLGFNVLK